METKGKVRYALVGAGNIAQMAVLPAFKHAKSNSELAAIVSGDDEKRRELRDKYEVDLVGDYGELEDLLAAGAINAIYVATPNSLHKEFVLRAAAAGVHVLCEKPLATSVDDAEEMAAACRRANVKLMVGYRLHFEEATLKGMKLVESGAIGDPRVFSSVFGHVVRPGDIRQRPEMGGGAMFDLGVFCVNAARNLFRSEPVLAFAVAQRGNGVDETTTAILQFPDQRIAHFTVSNLIAGISEYRIAGTEGDLRVEPAYEYADKISHHLTIDGDTKSENFGKRDQFAPELEYFSHCILENLSPEPNAEEGIDDLRAIDAILKSAETGKPIPLEPRVRGRRPDPSQESQKPAVSRQKPINAPSPSLK